MPKKEPNEIINWQLDGYPVTVEFYPTVIKIKDEANNIINIDKNKTL